MKKIPRLVILLLTVFIVAWFFRCSPPGKETDFIADNVKFAAEQYGLQTAIIEKSGEVLNPKSIIDGKMKYIRPQEWTSGFFPGSMWYLYQLTGDEKWRK